MGYILLLLGLAIWTGAHVFKRVAPERRAAMGDAGKGLVAVLLVGSIVLMVIGYRQRGLRERVVPTRLHGHIANLLVLIGFWFFALSAIPGTMSAESGINS
jgi:hypothetical protein